MSFLQGKNDPFENDRFVRQFITRRSEGDSVNKTVDQPVFLNKIKELNPNNILEIGCAAGGLSIELAQYCNQLIAIDQSSCMIEEARKHNSRNNISYLRQSLKEYTSTEKFDLIASGMVLHLIENLDEAIKKISVLLRYGGKFIFSQRHPIRTSNPQGSEFNNNLFSWKAANYFSEDGREYSWLDENVTCYHRSIDKLINTIIGNNFRIDALYEPIPLPEKSSSKKIEENLQIPSVLMIMCTKART